MERDPSRDPLVSRGRLMEAEVDGEMVGLHIASGNCYGFNGTAYRIWQLVEQPARLSQLCETLTREFNVASSTCEDDVRLLLDTLAADGLVTLSDPTP